MMSLPMGDAPGRSTATPNQVVPACAGPTPHVSHTHGTRDISYGHICEPGFETWLVSGDGDCFCVRRVECKPSLCSAHVDDDV
ncbi:hypothetical protein IG631_09781 [Alternaria alternata]|nr:hypothetical protein IG631_09781 [Alternaria alternata]